MLFPLKPARPATGQPPRQEGRRFGREPNRPGRVFAKPKFPDFDFLRFPCQRYGKFLDGDKLNLREGYYYFVLKEFGPLEDASKSKIYKAVLDVPYTPEKKDQTASIKPAPEEFPFSLASFILVDYFTGNGKAGEKRASAFLASIGLQAGTPLSLATSALNSTGLLYLEERPPGKGLLINGYFPRGYKPKGPAPRNSLEEKKGLASLLLQEFGE